MWVGPQEGISAFLRRESDAPLPHEHPLRTGRVGPREEEGSQQNPATQHPDLGLVASRTVRKSMSVVGVPGPGPGAFCYSSLSGLKQVPAPHGATSLASTQNSSYLLRLESGLAEL